MQLFRYVRRTTGDEDGNSFYSIKLEEFHVISETPLSYRIKKPYAFKITIVSKSATRRFAYPTKEEALFSFKKRTQMCARILKARLKDAEAYKSIIEKFEISPIVTPQ